MRIRPPPHNRDVPASGVGEEPEPWPISTLSNAVRLGLCGINAIELIGIVETKPTNATVLV
jgi:hypothetical protein